MVGIRHGKGRFIRLLPRFEPYELRSNNSDYWHNVVWVWFACVWLLALHHSPRLTLYSRREASKAPSKPPKPNTPPKIRITPCPHGDFYNFSILPTENPYCIIALSIFLLAVVSSFYITLLNIRSKVKLAGLRNTHNSSASYKKRN